MGAKRKSYTPKYRREAARLVVDTGRTIAEVAREIGVGEQLLGRWVAAERARMDDPPQALSRVGAVAPGERAVADGPGVPEKSRGLLREGDLNAEEAFEVIHAEKANFPVTRMTELLDVSRAGYYAWVDRQAAAPGPRAARRARLAVKIRKFHDRSEGVNGAPRILADLREDGEVVSRKTVAKIMREEQICGISPRAWTPATTIADEAPHSIPDLVKRNFDTGVLNAVWTSDITYLATGQGWLYLCAVRDGCSRRVLGYAFSETLHTDVVETALRRAVAFRDPGTGPTSAVVFHADRGCQYTSEQMAAVAAELDVRQSVGRTGVCWDNAQQESFWSTLKTEFYNRYKFATRAEAIEAVSRWINTVYNTRRRHSSLGQISPVQFEMQYINAAHAA